MSDTRPATVARLAGFFYLLTFVTGFYALASPRGRVVADIASSACYVIVTLLFYRIFKPVNAAVSLLAAVVSLIGCSVSILNRLGVTSSPVSPLAIFGGYCLLIGFLIVRSTFLPRFIGVLMAIGGVGWLTFASAALARRLSPYNFAPGIIGEGVLTLWPLIAGVNEARWQQTRAASHCELAADER